MIKFIYTIFTIIFIHVMSFVQAQPSFPNAPTQTPIGGLGLLAAAGGAMAVKKIINNRKK